MTAVNDITGDKIQTKQTSNAYLDNFDRIFRKQQLFDGVPLCYNSSLITKGDTDAIQRQRDSQVIS